MNAVSNLVYLNNNKLTTDSLKLAEAFDQRHADTLRKIEGILADTEGKFRERNFAFTSTPVLQPNGGTRDVPMYSMSRNGFMHIARTFTGKKGNAFSVQVIEAFEAMEAALIGAGLQEKSVSEDELIDLMYKRLKEKDQKISHLTLVNETEVAEHLITKKTSKIGPVEIGQLEAVIKAQANAIFPSLNWGVFASPNTVRSVIQKLVKAQYSGARTSSTFKEVTRADFQDCLDFVAAPTPDIVNTGRAFKNTDAQLQALRSVLLSKNL